MKAFVLLLAAATSLAACFLDIDFEGTNFSCADGECPAGFTCVDQVCVAASGDGGVDGDGGGDAAVDAAALLTCDEQYGAATGYMLCAETETTCEFFVMVEVAATCTDICALYQSGTCQASYDATAGTACTRETADEACAVTHGGQLCVCSRNPASG